MVVKKGEGVRYIDSYKKNKLFSATNCTFRTMYPPWMLKIKLKRKYFKPLSYLIICCCNKTFNFVSFQCTVCFRNVKAHLQKSLIKDIIQFPFAIFAKIWTQARLPRIRSCQQKKHFLYENSWYLILCLKVPPHSSSRPSTFFIYKHSIEEIFFIETYKPYIFSDHRCIGYIFICTIYTVYYSVICRLSDRTVGRPRAEIRTRDGRSVEAGH